MTEENSIVIESKPKQKYNCIDLVKFIMALSVILGHTYIDPGIHATNIVTLIINNYLDIVVPFFFMASGYLMAKKMHSPFTVEDTATMKVHFLKITKLYAILMLVYTPLAIYHFYDTQNGLVPSIKEYVFGVIFRGEQYNAWPLWYLHASVYALLFLLICFKCKVNLRGLLIASAVFAVISISFDWMEVQAYNDLPKILAYATHSLGISGRAFRGIIYLPIGMLFTKINPNRWICLGAFLASFVLNCLADDNIILNGFVVILCSISFFGVIYNLPLKDSRVYPIFRKSSTIIYFVHMYVWTLYYFFVYGKKMLGLDCFLFTTIESIAISLIYIEIKNILKKRKNLK